MKKKKNPRYAIRIISRYQIRDIRFIAFSTIECLKYFHRSSGKTFAVFSYDCIYT